MRKFGALLEITESRFATRTAGLLKDAHRVEFEYTPRPGYLYVRSRAISSRTNDNHDTFPAEEITAAYRSFIGKPVFVNHNNDDHRRARGVIVDAALHQDTNPDRTPDTWVEVLMEVDAIKFPKLAEAIVKGHIDRTSMGCDVEYSLCSFCGNKARSPVEYCQHIPALKGQRIRRVTAAGQREDVLVSELCYGLKFFENSLLVEEPADPTAFVVGEIIDGSNPPPRRTSTNSSDGRGGHSELGFNLGESQLPTLSRAATRSNIGEQQFDGPNIGFRQATRRVRRPAQTAVSLDHVAGILPVGSKNPVRRVVAKRNVTSMANDHSLRDGSNEILVAPTMRSHTAALDVVESQSAVPVVESSANSRPARLRPTTAIDFREIPRKNAHRGQHMATREVPVRIRRRADVEGDEKVIVPPNVDTLRETKCFAGLDDSSCGFDGSECLVCGYVKPPDKFDDPNLDIAKEFNEQRDQEASEEAMAEQGLTNPNDMLGGQPDVEEEVLLGEDGLPLEEEGDEFATEEGDEFVEEGDEEFSEDEEGDDEFVADDESVEQEQYPEEEEEFEDEESADPKRKKKPMPNPRQGQGRSARQARAVQQDQSLEGRVRAQAGIIRRQSAQLRQQQTAIAGLGKAVEMLAASTGNGRRLAVLFKHADEMNPAQPVPEPAAGPATTTTEAEQFAATPVDLFLPGDVPGATDVAPDAVTSPSPQLDNSMVVAPPNYVDVTQPVAGTGAGEIPIQDIRTEVDVRVGPDAASVPTWPGDATQASKRTYAALACARLRIQAGIANGGDMVVAQAIEASNMTTAAIESEVDTLTKVLRASASRQPGGKVVARRNDLVPKLAGNGGSDVMGAPRLASGAPSFPNGVPLASGPSEDEMAFE